MSVLNQHKKTNKACLELQGKKSIYVCGGCGKDFSNKNTLENHTSKCGAKKNIDRADIVSHLQAEIKQLKISNEALAGEVKYLRGENEYLRGAGKNTAISSLKPDRKLPSNCPIEPFNVETIKKKLPEDLSVRLENYNSVVVSTLFEIIKYGDQRNYLFSDSPGEPAYRFAENGKWVVDAEGEYFDSVLSLFSPYLIEVWDKSEIQINLAMNQHNEEERDRIKGKRDKMWDTRLAISNSPETKEWKTMKKGIIDAIRSIQNKRMSVCSNVSSV